MARTPNEKYRKAKERKILESARLVFCRKGYLDVTMQDIIDECGISRGGIYLYFSSISEIFREVAARRNKEKFSVIRNSVDNNEPFAKVLGNYMALQKERLLHMENSLVRAMYEYNLSRAEGSTQAFRNAQLEYLRRSVLSILVLGVEQNVIRDDNIMELADHIIIVIEGLSVLALTDMLTENIIDEQFTMLNAMINSRRIDNYAEK